MAIQLQRQSGSRLGTGITLALAGLVAACSPQPEPRSFLDFMEDGLAREGVLSRCNQNRGATSNDIECLDARRAAAAVAVERERARMAGLERESQRKLIALRDRAGFEAETQLRAAVASRAVAEAAYEARWRNPAGERAAAPSGDEPVPTFGAPLGAVLPSMSESTLFDAYAEGALLPRLPGLEVAAAEPPANDITIAVPDLAVEELAAIPRPFRADN